MDYSRLDVDAHVRYLEEDDGSEGDSQFFDAEERLVSETAIAALQDDSQGEIGGESNEDGSAPSGSNDWSWIYNNSYSKWAAEHLGKKVYDTLNSGPVGSQVGTALLHGLNYGLVKKVNLQSSRDYINQQTGSPNFSLLLGKAAQKLTPIAIKKAQDLDLKCAAEFIQGQTGQIQQIIEFILLKVGENFIKKTVRDADPSIFPDDLFCRMTVHILERIIGDIKEINPGALKVIEQDKTLTSEEKQEQINQILKPIADKLMNIALPNGKDDLPIKMEFLRNALWSWLDDHVFPVLVLNVYHLILDPKDKFQKTIVRDSETLDQISKIAAAQVVEQAPGLVEGNSRLIAEKVSKFLSLDRQQNPWLSEKMALISSVNHPGVKDIFGFFEGYLETLIHHLIINLSDDKTNVILGSYHKLASLTEKFLKENPRDLENDETYERLAASLIQKGGIEEECMNYLPQASSFLGIYIAKGLKFVMGPKKAFDQTVNSALVDMTTLDAISAIVAKKLSPILKELLKDNAQETIGKYFNSHDTAFLTAFMMENIDHPAIQPIYEYVESTIQAAVKHIVLKLSNGHKDPVASALKKIIDRLVKFLEENQAALAKKDKEYITEIDAIAAVVGATRKEVLAGNYDTSKLTESQLKDLEICTSKIEKLVKHQLDLFSQFSKDLLHESGLDFLCRTHFPKASELMARYLLTFYRDMTWESKNMKDYEDGFIKLLQPSLPYSSEDIEENAANFRKMQLATQTMKRFRESCQAIGKDVREMAQKYVKENGHTLTDLPNMQGVFQMLGDREEIWSYLENVFSDLMFKIAVTQADLSKSAVDDDPMTSLLKNLIGTLFEEGNQNFEGIEETILFRINELKDGVLKSELQKIANKNLKGSTYLKELYVKHAVLSSVEKPTETQIALMGELQKLLVAAFSKSAKALLQSACKDPQNELLEMIPAMFRPMVFNMIGEQFLPKLFVRLYGELMGFEFQREKNVKGIKQVIKHVKDPNNHLLSLPTLLGSWTAQYLRHYIAMNGKKTAEKLYKLIPHEYTEGLKKEMLITDHLQRNIEQMMTDPSSEPLKTTMPILKKYFESAFLQVLNGFVQTLDGMEYPKGVESHETFKKLLEEVLKALNHHLKLIHNISVEQGTIIPWKVGKTTMMEGFKRKKQLHPALLGDTEAYFKDFSRVILQLSGVGSYEQFTAMPEELKKPVFEAIADSVFPAVLENIFDKLVDPHTVNKLLYSTLTMQSDLVKDLEKYQFTENLGVVTNLVQSTIPSFLAVVEEGPKNPNWIYERDDIIKQISDLQRKLYLVQDLKEHQIIKAWLYELKLQLKHFEPINDDNLERVAKINEMFTGTAEENGLIKIIAETQEKLIDYKLTKEDKENDFNTTCGELFLHVVDLLPHNILIHSLFKSQNIKEMTAAVIGKAIRKQANSWTLLKMINQGTEAGLKNLSKGDWFYTNGDRKFIPGEWVELKEVDEGLKGNLFHKIDDHGTHYKFIEKDDFDFEFGTTPEKEKLEKVEREQLKKQLLKAIVDTVDESIKNGIRSYFSKKVEYLEDMMDTSVTFAFGKKIGKEFEEARKKMFQDEKSFANKLISVVSKFLDLVFHPFNVIFWFCINRVYFEPRAKQLMNTISLEINENLVYEVFDILLGTLLKLPEKPNQEEPAISEKELKEIKKKEYEIKSKRKFPSMNFNFQLFN